MLERRRRDTGVCLWLGLIGKRAASRVRRVQSVLEGRVEQSEGGGLGGEECVQAYREGYLPSLPSATARFSAGYKTLTLFQSISPYPSWD
jgi:hypothetical protein